MRNTKIGTEYIENRFDFPVLINNVSMVEIKGKWITKINYNKFSDTVLKQLIIKDSFLIGNEIKFIRTKFEMNLDYFVKRFYVSHQAVIKWENTKNSPTKMSWETEKDIRLFIYNKLTEKGFLELYNKLEKKQIIKQFKILN
ncbi:MAG: hypothetical protein AABZ74_14625 [Cyanobacteriota bacterium]